MVACYSHIKCIDITKHFISYSVAFSENRSSQGKSNLRSLGRSQSCRAERQNHPRPGTSGELLQSPSHLRFCPSDADDSVVCVFFARTLAPPMFLLLSFVELEYSKFHLLLLLIL